MKLTEFTFRFKRGKISVWAFCKEDAEILAMAEAIKNGWDYTIIG